MRGLNKDGKMEVMPTARPIGTAIQSSATKISMISIVIYRHLRPSFRL